MTKHEQILSLLPIILEEPIIISNERIYSISGNKEHGIWLRTSDESWHKLEESDQNYDMVADAILNHYEPLQS